MVVSSLFHSAPDPIGGRAPPARSIEGESLRPHLAPLPCARQVRVDCVIPDEAPPHSAPSASGSPQHQWMAPGPPAAGTPTQGSASRTSCWATSPEPSTRSARSTQGHAWYGFSIVYFLFIGHLFWLVLVVEFKKKDKYSLIILAIQD